MATFFTIGHSTRSIEEFTEILKSEKNSLVVDVRTVPRSRTNPQFNSDTLWSSLAEENIEYVHLAELGGLRGRQRNVQPSPNAFWENQSFRNYADYAMTDAFRSGFEKLKKLGETKRCVIMCAETLWWRCHRRIITDYLIFTGETVIHILGLGKTALAKPTPAARPVGTERLIYPDTVVDSKFNMKEA